MALLDNINIGALDRADADWRRMLEDTLPDDDVYIPMSPEDIAILGFDPGMYRDQAITDKPRKPFEESKYRRESKGKKEGGQFASKPKPLEQSRAEAARMSPREMIERYKEETGSKRPPSAAQLAQHFGISLSLEGRREAERAQAIAAFPKTAAGRAEARAEVRGTAESAKQRRQSLLKRMSPNEVIEIYQAETRSHVIPTAQAAVMHFGFELTPEQHSELDQLFVEYGPTAQLEVASPGSEAFETWVSEWANLQSTTARGEAAREKTRKLRSAPPSDDSPARDMYVQGVQKMSADELIKRFMAETQTPDNDLGLYAINRHYEELLTERQQNAVAQRINEMDEARERDERQRTQRRARHEVQLEAINAEARAEYQREVEKGKQKSLPLEGGEGKKPVEAYTQMIQAMSVDELIAKYEEDQGSTIDYTAVGASDFMMHFERLLSEEQLRGLEDRINEQTKFDLPYPGSGDHDFDKQPLTQEHADQIGERMTKNVKTAFPDLADQFVFRTVPSGSDEITFNAKIPGTETSITRTFKWEHGEVDHSYFKLDSSYQGKGGAKSLLRESFDLYHDLGFSTVTVNANIDVGAYAWAKFGFIPTDYEWRNLKGDLHDWCENYKEKLHDDYLQEKLTGEEDDEARDKLEEEFMERDDVQEIESMMFLLDESDDPRDLWKVVDSETIVEHEGRRTTIGKAMLIDDNKSWNGYYDLNDSDMEERFNDYVSSKKAKK